MTAPATLTVYNVLRDLAGNAISGATVRCVLSSGFATVTASGDSIAEVQLSATTDGSGRYAFTLVGTDLLSPANQVYTIMEPHRSYDIAPLSSNGASQQTTASNVIVSTPTALAPATSNVTGPLTVSGGLTVSSGGLSVSGGLTVASGSLSIPAGGFSMAGPLTLTAPASSIIPGATSMSLRNHANGADNLLISDAGVVTVRAGLTVTTGGATLNQTAGTVLIANRGDGAAALMTHIVGQRAASSKWWLGLDASDQFALLNAGATQVNLGMTDAGVATLRGGLIVTAGGLTITAGGETITAGNLSLTAGNLVFAAASAKIVSGATSLLVRNNADSASNLAITDAGILTTRNALEVAPSAGGALPTHSYGTVPVKLDEQSTASAASLTLTVPAGGLYRALTIYFHGRSDQAGAQNLVLQFNGDTAANYDYQYFTDTNATLGQNTGLAQASGLIGTLTPSGAAAGSITGCIVEVFNADSASLRKSWIARSGSQYTDAVANFVMLHSKGEWRNAAAGITSILIKPAAGNLITARAVLIGMP